MTIKILAWTIYYKQRYREQTVNNLHKKAQQLSFNFIRQPQTNAVS
ncbi:hypothetical protein H6G97_10035 [Nostoc flagelliforme FACHB-838]|uniref:Transposase n=1 Tax=Nostoc flagelliforme FACHB-838 TaxID=2692904 RepID=A0ABR8DLS3_9NOSO|nr:hypothetical protein [Nostoc flagelliforme FACHB-838]